MFLYIIYYIDCLAVNKVGFLNPVEYIVGFEPKRPIFSQNLNPLGYFLLDYLSNIGLLSQ